MLGRGLHLFCHPPLKIFYVLIYIFALSFTKIAVPFFLGREGGEDLKKTFMSSTGGGGDGGPIPRSSTRAWGGF